LGSLAFIPVTSFQFQLYIILATHIQATDSPSDLSPSIYAMGTALRLIVVFFAILAFVTASKYKGKFTLFKWVKNFGLTLAIVSLILLFVPVYKILISFLFY